MLKHSFEGQGHKPTYSFCRFLNSSTFSKRTGRSFPRSWRCLTSVYFSPRFPLHPCVLLRHWRLWWSPIASPIAAGFGSPPNKASCPGMFSYWFYTLQGNGIWREEGLVIQRAPWPFLSSHSTCKASHWSSQRSASVGQWTVIWSWAGKSVDSR